MQSQLNPLASEIIKKCLPNGLEVPFPQNVSSIILNHHQNPTAQYSNLFQPAMT
jgi:hypothetical protein